MAAPALHGIDIKIVFIFPPTINPQQLQHFFTRPGVYGLQIIEGTLRGQKIIPLVRHVNRQNVRRSARIAALPQQEVRQNWIVAATIHYPHPMLEIRKEIDNAFGKDIVRVKNFTDYDSLITTRVGDVALGEGAANDPMCELAALFGHAGIGGKRRRQTRRRKASRKTRKSKRRAH